ncbi:unnamed protein product [Acanthosepion pharaonis]|uniref:Uncharacterized protein n=1 Tax=Acanthosepion pharaonis TaxID=158019 RepID=A0A812CGU0_ACAPH|nr:unnamed protein product [Sepia pharaonis]
MYSRILRRQRKQRNSLPLLLFFLSFFSFFGFPVDFSPFSSLACHPPNLPTNLTDRQTANTTNRPAESASHLSLSFFLSLSLLLCFSFPQLLLMCLFPLFSICFGLLIKPSLSFLFTFPTSPPVVILRLSLQPNPSLSFSLSLSLSLFFRVFPPSTIHLPCILLSILISLALLSQILHFLENSTAPHSLIWSLSLSLALLATTCEHSLMGPTRFVHILSYLPADICLKSMHPGNKHLHRQ